MRIKIKSRGKPLLAAQMQNDISISQIFNPISSVQNIKIFSANGDVLVKSFWRNIFSVGMDGK